MEDALDAVTKHRHVEIQDQPDVDADALDTPAGADEVVNFTPDAGTPATVTANQNTTVNFSIPAGP